MTALRCQRRGFTALVTALEENQAKFGYLADTEKTTHEVAVLKPSFSSISIHKPRRQPLGPALLQNEDFGRIGPACVG